VAGNEASDRSGESRFSGLEQKTAKERAAVLRRWFDLMMATRTIWRADDPGKGQALTDRKAKSLMRLPSLMVGEKPARCMATPYPQIKRQADCGHQAGPSESLRASRRGIFLWR